MDDPRITHYITIGCEHGHITFGYIPPWLKTDEEVDAIYAYWRNKRESKVKPNVEYWTKIRGKYRISELAELCGLTDRLWPASLRCGSKQKGE